MKPSTSRGVVNPLTPPDLFINVNMTCIICSINSLHISSVRGCFQSVLSFLISAWTLPPRSGSKRGNMMVDDTAGFIMQPTSGTVVN